MLTRFTPFALAFVAAGCSSPASEGNAVRGARATQAQPVEGATDNAASQSAGAREGSGAASPGAAITADTPIDSENPTQVMEARSRGYDRLEYKPVTLDGFTSGDNAYVELTPRVEGAAPETLLCTARLCADWRDAGGLPKALRLAGATAKFGTADQVDGSGTVMRRGVRAVVDLRLDEPRTARNTAGDAPSAPPLPLTPGVYVLEGADCRNPANAAFRVWNGRGLSGSATKDCRATVLSRAGERYTLRNSCVNTYDGSRTPETITLRVPDQVHFAVGDNRFRSCSMAQVPASLRELVR